MAWDVPDYGRAPRQPRRWFNSSQPQTLQAAVIFLYFIAALDLITGLLSGLAVYSLVGVVLAALSAWGLANERKWAYVLAVVVASLGVLGLLYELVIVHSFGAVIDLVFIGALLALLLHPQTREYRRIWFH
jgi:uncharacterized membrane protein